MIKIYTRIILFALMAFSFNSHTQIVINEIFPQTNKVEIKNTGASMVDIGSWQLCNFPDYDPFSGRTFDCGSTNLQPGQIAVVTVSWDISATDGEMGLYVNGNFGDPGSMRDYVEWGSTGHTRASVAVNAGIWTDGDFVPSFPTTSSLEYDGTDENSSNWSPVATNSLCSENNSIVTNRNQTIDRGLNVFPNPSSDRIHLDLKDTPYDMELIKIIDATGKEIRSQTIGSSKQTIEIDDLVRGLYHMQILINQNYYHRKVIVI